MTVTAEQTEHGLWHCHTRLDKYEEDAADFDPEAWAKITPYETIEVEGNILVTAGINYMLDALAANPATLFSNANAAIGVGDSTTAAAAGQTDLQAATNKLRKGMLATYPTAATAGSKTFSSNFLTGEANWVWNEWGVFNSTTNGAGTMLNRKVEALGTKTSGTWTLSTTISVS